MKPEMKHSLEKKKLELITQIGVLEHEIYTLQNCITERYELINECRVTIDVINEQINSSTQLINPADETE